MRVARNARRSRAREAGTRTGQAGNGLNDIGAAEHGLVPAGPSADQDSERDTHDYRQQSGGDHHAKVLERQLKNFSVILQYEAEDVHAESRFPFEGVAPNASRYFCTSGS